MHTISIFNFLLLTTITTTLASTTCTLKKNLIIGTGSIKIINTHSTNECCAECYAFGYSCKAFTYQLSTGTCYLKDNFKTSTPSTDRTSGITSSSPTPAPLPNHTKTTRACLPGISDHYPFCNTSLTLEERVDNLISLLKPEEIPALLTAREGGGGSPGPAGNISRIGLPEYDWGVNCIHGVQTTCGTNTQGKIVCPTSFPNPNALGASFNRTMFREIGAIIGLELRALWLQGATEASSWSGRPHAGLDCWSPNINVNRDPRWGRNQEVASEDPFYNGIFGTEYTKGLQIGSDERFIQAVVTLKHWDAYSLEDADGYTRHNFNAIISNYTLADTYFPAFKATVQKGGALGVMCSYNSLNGVPTCANSFLNNVLRKEWGFNGYITSDTGAIEDIYKEHKYTKDGPSATCAALKDGGCDINSGAVYSNYLLDAVGDTTLDCDMNDVKTALQRTLGLRFKLGLFDPIEDQPLWNVSMDVVGSQNHISTNQLATKESMVLLQNDATLGLPFEIGKTIAVIGPHTNASAALVGNYLGQICPDGVSDLSCVETPYEAIVRINVGGRVVSSAGCTITGNITGGIAAAIEIAKTADYIVLMLGIDQSVEGESHDRTHIDLPLSQHLLAAAILGLGKSSVVVLVNGGMVAIEEEKKMAPSILETFYPGFWGASAIADTIFEMNDHLGGKLPITIYSKEYINQVKMSDMSFKPHNSSPGRSYRYYTGAPTFPAFTGMSLTTFNVSKSKTDQNTDVIIFQTGDTNISLTYGIKVTNTGTRKGDEVVFMFASSKNEGDGPIRRLTGFERVHLSPGESKILHFSIDIDTVKITDSATGNIISSAGNYEVSFSTGGIDYFAVQQVRVQGDDVVMERFPSF